MSFGTREDFFSPALGLISKVVAFSAHIFNSLATGVMCLDGPSKAKPRGKKKKNRPRKPLNMYERICHRFMCPLFYELHDGERPNMGRHGKAVETNLVPRC